MMKRIFKTCLWLLILIDCGNQYQPIPPESVHFGEATFKGSGGHEIVTKFIYSVPGNYSPEKSFPLIIALHGYGSNAAAFHDLWKSVTDTSGFVLLTPQAENRTEEGIGWHWGNHAERSVLISMEIVRKSVNIDRRRMYVAGFSAGGRLAYFLGLRHPYMFTGLAALGAPFKAEFLPDKKILLNKIKAYIGHGSLEKKIAEDAKFAAKKLRESGVQVKYVEYEGIGHDLPVPKKLELQRILNFFGAKE